MPGRAGLQQDVLNHGSGEDVSKPSKFGRDLYKQELAQALFGKPKKIRDVNGVKFLQNFTLLLLGLKLTGHFEGSWWLVFLPLAIDSIGVFVGQRVLKSIQRTLGHLPDPDDYK